VTRTAAAREAAAIEVLREAVKNTPARVVAFVEPRAAQLSGVTWREATRKLPARERRRLELARSAPIPFRGRE
jgi:hypothetical protein